MLQRDGRYETANQVYVRSRQLNEGFPVARRQRVHIATLRFRMHGVKGKARLSRSGTPTDHHQFAKAEVHIDPPEAMLSRATNLYAVHAVQLPWPHPLCRKGDHVRYRLLQARDPDDPVREEERIAFAARLGVEDTAVVPFDMIATDPHPERVCHDVDALLVGGAGRYGVQDDYPWITRMIDRLGEIADTGTPMFASCFGFQALVMAMGGQVEPLPGHEEVGTFEIERTNESDTDPIFGPLPRRFAVQLGHKDHATTFPESCIRLAFSELCAAQALRIPGKPVWATQFHPELTLTENLSRLDRYRKEYIAAFGLETYNALVRGFHEAPIADQLLSRFAMELHT